VPRNSSKARCAVPGCKSWAMRGHTHCRTHRDRELGPRHGGGQPGNLNALRHARSSGGLPEPELDRLVAAAIDNQGQDLALQVGLAIQAIQSRTGDPFCVLLALDRVSEQSGDPESFEGLDRLIDRVATQVLHRELSEALAPIPQPRREPIQDNIERLAARDGPRKTLITFRQIKRQREKKTEQ